MQQLDVLQIDFIKTFSAWLDVYLQAQKKHQDIASILADSQSYSLLSGGKRFRPFLCALVYRLFASDNKKIQNFCLALEMIHTYSLIHDDLPCMDNDDFRRGKPTNHKVFSEEIALLAGDALLTDVFYFLASDQNLSHQVRTELISCLALRIGSAGMISGQVFDMRAEKGILLAELQQIHRLKTANLIQAAALGATIIAEVSAAEKELVAEFSHQLGLAFQIKDDLLDAHDPEQDFKSYLSVIGVEQTESELQAHSDKAREALKKLKLETDVLLQLVDFNLNRTS